MYQKTKSTLAGLVVWGLLLAVSLTLGEPLESPAPAFQAEPFVQTGAPAEAASAPSAPAAGLESGAAVSLPRLNFGRQLRMPYYSFGSLLPRRES